jgi:hypothetical protein
MQFDYATFFSAQGIEYRDSGPNVKKGNLNISCPFCAHDEKFFMGVDPKTGWFGCNMKIVCYNTRIARRS